MNNNILFYCVVELWWSDSELVGESVEQRWNGEELVCRCGSSLSSSADSWRWWERFGDRPSSRPVSELGQQWRSWSGEVVEQCDYKGTTVRRGEATTFCWYVCLYSYHDNRKLPGLSTPQWEFPVYYDGECIKGQIIKDLLNLSYMT